MGSKEEEQGRVIVIDTHSDVIGQLHGAVLVLIYQVDTVQVLKNKPSLTVGVNNF